LFTKLLPRQGIEKQGDYFMRWLSFAALTAVLSGCAVPPAITIASLVADVASYASTGKTLTDHGISMVLQKDCALLRGLEGEICLEPDPARTAREREARNLRYEYPGDTDHSKFVRAPADPADRFAATLAYTADPEVTPRPAGRAADEWLTELSYLGDSLDPTVKIEPQNPHFRFTHRVSHINTPNPPIT